MSRDNSRALSVTDFGLTKDNKPQAVFIFSDWEPDDIQAIVILTRVCCGLNIPVWIISGGADNRIQNKRAETYIKVLLADNMPGGKKWLNENVHFLKGVGSKNIPGLGSDVLSPAELKMLADSKDSKSETSAIQEALAKHPQCFVFCIKKPDELIGHPELLSLLSEATLVTYTGGFNYQGPELKSIDKDAPAEVKQAIEAQNASIVKAHQEGIQALFSAFKKVGIVQNYHMLQGANPKDPTPRDIMPAHTPRFVKVLREDKSALGLAIRKSIRVWNEKTILDMQRKVAKFATDRGENHAAGTARLKEIFARKPLELNDETLSEIKEAVKLLDENDPEIKFRKKMWLNVLENMEIQCVIADQLTAFVVCHPDAFSSPGVPGTLSFTKEGFIEVIPAADSKAATCLCFSAIEGGAGIPQNGGTRISAVDKFLCDMVLSPDLQLGSSHRLVGVAPQPHSVVTKTELEAKLSKLMAKQQALNKNPIIWEIITEQGQPCAKMRGALIPAGGEEWFRKTLNGITVSFKPESPGSALIVHNVDAASFEPVKSAALTLS